MVGRSHHKFLANTFEQRCAYRRCGSVVSIEIYLVCCRFQHRKFRIVRLRQIEIYLAVGVGLDALNAVHAVARIRSSGAGCAVNVARRHRHICRQRTDAQRQCRQVNGLAVAVLRPRYAIVCLNTTAADGNSTTATV